MKTLAMVATIGLLGGLAAVPLVAANVVQCPKGVPCFWVAAGTVNDPTTDDAILGLVICQANGTGTADKSPDAGIGGICDIDCQGLAALCTIVVTDKNGLDTKFIICDDKDKDGFFAQCTPATGKWTNVGTFPKKAPHIVTVFISQGVNGDLVSLDP